MLSYRGKLVLAPMVRSGEIPTRIMALKYGADLVWGPEIVDKKLIKCVRKSSDEKIVDFVEKDTNKVVFRTDRIKEKGKLVFQLGTADPELAVEAARIIAKDVDAIDLNCGCPKPFSTHSGMGAALLSNPDLLETILRRLVEKVGNVYLIPISAKIRLLDAQNVEPTLGLIERICKTGIANLTLHCRTRNMRNREEPLRHFLPEIIAKVEMHNVSLIINGAVHNRKEFELLQQKYGADVGAMIAENAECNPSVFSRVPQPWKVVVPEFIRIAIAYKNYPANTKYIILNQIPGKSAVYQKICRVKTHQEFLDVIGEVGDEGNRILMRYLQKDVLISPDHFESYEYETSRKRKRNCQTEKQQKDSGIDDKRSKTVVTLVS